MSTREHKRRKARVEKKLAKKAKEPVKPTRLEHASEPKSSISLKNVVRETGLERLKQSLAAAENSPEAKRKSSERRKAALLSGEQSRQMRNQQSAINKDIKSTEKAMKGTKDSGERANLEHRLKQLKDLKDTMAASFKGDYGKVYNPADARIDAMNEYMTKFKGAAHLDEQRVYRVRIDSDYSANFMRRFERRWRDAVNEATDESAYANTVQYQDLYDDYIRAIRSFDSDEAKRVVSKMESGKKRYYASHPKLNQGRKAK